jgi:hypothetical protein
MVTGVQFIAWRDKIKSVYAPARATEASDHEALVFVWDIKKYRHI